MLRQCVSVICEKVLISQPDEIPSLINLFSKMIVTRGPDQQIPKDAVTPKEWSIFILFEVEPEDVGRPYVTCAQIVYPDGSPFGETARISLTTHESKKRAQVYINIPAFPIGQVGFYVARIWVEENNKEIMKPIELGIEVEHKDLPKT